MQLGESGAVTFFGDTASTQYAYDSQLSTSGFNLKIGVPWLTSTAPDATVALALANSRLVHDAASLIATRLTAAVPPNDDAAFVRQAFRTVLGASPAEAETAAWIAEAEATGN